MARKQQQAGNQERFKNIRRGLIIATLASAALVALLWGAIQLEHFLIRDPQFTLALPPDPGEESPAVEIIGVKHASRAYLASTFDRDYGRSIYLMPLRQRRDELLRLQWVKDARVTRVWPNRLQVRVTEREPVAFVQLPGESVLPLIDVDGHVLMPETQETLNLPILSGVTREQSDEDRRLRVHRLQKLVSDAGPELSAKISEVDASDPDNLKIMQDAGGKAVTLIIGKGYFKRRLEKFRQNADDLLRRDPAKTIFDLRKDGSIYARPSQTLTAEGVRPSD